MGGEAIASVRGTTGGRMGQPNDGGGNLRAEEGNRGPEGISKPKEYRTSDSHPTASFLFLKTIKI